MKPWFLLSPKMAHQLSPIGLKLYSLFNHHENYRWRPLHWKNLYFPNPLGIAGGVDKNAKSIREWWAMGAGFLEIGTVTPKPQEANPGIVMMRDIKNQALWNRMGFPNDGAEVIAERIKQLPKPFSSPLFINIGKNRHTPLEFAQDDYLRLMKIFAPLADALVINISSPNTTDLRKLQGTEYLNELLNSLKRANEINTPLLLKLSPDLNSAELESVLQSSFDKVDGWILTNTTTARPPHINFPQEGGLSGLPLATRSKEILSRTQQILGSERKEKLIISAGGITSPRDVIERLQLGADLIETYSGLVFHGPRFFVDTMESFR